MINNLFNNDELLELLNKNGFKIIFKPHFELLKYCELFDIPDEVILSKNESYQELFNKSMLMITDYSSVFLILHTLKNQLFISDQMMSFIMIQGILILILWDSVKLQHQLMNW